MVLYHHSHHFARQTDIETEQLSKHTQHLQLEKQTGCGAAEATGCTNDYTNIKKCQSPFRVAGPSLAVMSVVSGFEDKASQIACRAIQKVAFEL